MLGIVTGVQVLASARVKFHRRAVMVSAWDVTVAVATVRPAEQVTSDACAVSRAATHVELSQAGAELAQGVAAAAADGQAGHPGAAGHGELLAHGMLDGQAEQLAHGALDGQLEQLTHGTIDGHEAPGAAEGHMGQGAGDGHVALVELGDATGDWLGQTGHASQLGAGTHDGCAMHASREAFRDVAAAVHCTRAAVDADARADVVLSVLVQVDKLARALMSSEVALEAVACAT